MGKLLLASLYRALGKATMQMKLLHESNKALNISGPIWLLQLWLNATFEHVLGCPAAVEASPINTKRPIEGLRLALMTAQIPQTRTLFSRYISMFVEANTFQ